MTDAPKDALDPVTVEGHDLKPGDLVIRSVSYNRHPRAKPFKKENIRIEKITKAGFVYLERNMGKFRGESFPLAEWYPRGYGSRQYIVRIEGRVTRPERTST